jgi:hypothetical protein
MVLKQTWPQPILTSGAAGVAGFLEGVKNAVTGFNNVLKLI